MSHVIVIMMDGSAMIPMMWRFIPAFETKQTVIIRDTDSRLNIREKLAGKPYLKAVHRHLSVDTTENRLFKDFSLKLERYLIERVDALKIGYDQSEYELLGLIKKWFKSDDAAEIIKLQGSSPIISIFISRESHISVHS